eukprot:CAMPEP_0185012568 /NCGR_PEP_ID=MMETSP1098-20130426/98369_1 /TAXON_ID=89044 /ORGANISM="Spumella elongata, Strain CCAP 955/1" /LENGTH=246 /DNA_ID=CAMNT_0027541633 /DNA_START=135 /DNA_END=875 /DNA_ORIENTATION=+
MSKFNYSIHGKEGVRREPFFVKDLTSMSLEHFYIPTHYQDTLGGLMIPAGAIHDRIEKLAHDIMEDYHGVTIHLICVLKGGSTFFSDLSSCMKKIHNYNREKYIPYTFDFIRVKSYEGTSSTGNVKIDNIDVSTLAGKHVLFVEDIIDTGLTMSRLLAYLKDQVKPASIRVASLLEKRTDRSCGFKADYVGFSVPDEFAVGYCLDYNEVYRDLPHIGVINQLGIDKFRDYETKDHAAAAAAAVKEA